MEYSSDFKKMINQYSRELLQMQKKSKACPDSVLQDEQMPMFDTEMIRPQQPDQTEHTEMNENEQTNQAPVAMSESEKSSIAPPFDSMQENTNVPPAAIGEFPAVTGEPPAVANEPSSIGTETANIPTQIPLEDLRATGYLRAEVSTGRGATPIENAYVFVTYTDNSGKERLMASVMTNIDGETPLLELPALSADLSLTPGNSRPYVYYAIQINKDGYYTIKNKFVPVFAGQTSIQQIEMLPLPENFQGNSVIEMNNTAPESTL